ncbi:signal peptidase I [Lysinibacillus sp. UGB7]|uniref:signal peptidase I n=1 Tax=Lysinibacillus sp. UGB7 TaxID=3411039 RepID=UPI003B78C9BB
MSNDVKEKEENKVLKFAKVIGEYLMMFAIALCIAFGLKLAFEPTVVSGISMEPTLQNGDRMLLNTFKEVENGDIIVFNWTERNSVLIKRAVAVAGDHIQINEDGVFLNGKLLEENYTNSEPTIASEPIDIVVPEGKIFAMGDNRMHSLDSRADVGLVDETDVLGVRMIQIWEGDDE